MKYPLRSLLVVLAPLALTFCGDKNTNAVGLVVGPGGGPVVNGAVSMLDQCDSASFNAAVGAGTCTTAGSVTFDAFSAELVATKSVSAWKFDPTILTITVGGNIVATNHGGEVHTFTNVAEFGGGIVPALNDASGNPIEASECKDLTDANMIAPGASMTTGTATTVGTYKYQCCIHPWMRGTVTVTGP